MRKEYSASFFEGIIRTAAPSAEVVVPIVMEMLHPRSVVDVGCGQGSWLAQFRAAGVDDVLGVDGPWVDKEAFRVPSELFHCAELERPLEIGRRFDVAVSLEVAEHLPARSADAFVKSLASLADVVVFSAAVPLQGGTHHVNEQWHRYWAEKFRGHGFEVVDLIRPLVWWNDQVAPVYAQNMLVYAKPAAISANAALAAAHRATDERMLDLVNPRFFHYRCADAEERVDFFSDASHHSVASLLTALPRKAWRFFRRLFEEKGKPGVRPTGPRADSGGELAQGGA